MLPSPGILIAALLSSAVLPLAAKTPGRQAPASASCPAPAAPDTALGDAARTKLQKSLEAARAHARHVWRDTLPVNPDRTVNVFVEIAPGSREKFEFDMAANERKLDRVVPEKVGGYPMGYGFVPGTIGPDGDPFDGLVLGEGVQAGSIVRGHVLGIMHMTDEKGSDSKVVVTAEPDPATRRGMLAREKERMTEFFNRYKADDDDPRSFACVSVWGDEAEARRYVDGAARLFQEGRK